MKTTNRMTQDAVSNSTISIIATENEGWRYVLRGRTGLVLDTRAGYKTRSEAEGACHMWLRDALRA